MPQITVIPTPEENTQNMDVTLRRKLEKMLTELFTLSSVLTGEGELVGILTVTPPNGDIQFPGFTGATVLGVSGDGSVISTGVLNADLAYITGVTSAVQTQLDSKASSAALAGKVDGTPGVKVYRALLTQTGTAAPVATVLENSLGGTVVWTRTAQGIYLGTLASTFSALKTFLSINPGSLVDEGGGASAFIGRVDDNSVRVYSSDTDEELLNTPIEILVYP